MPPVNALFHPSTFFPKQTAKTHTDFVHHICWSHARYFPQLCCFPPGGLQSCFNNHATYHFCCSEFIARARGNRSAGRWARSIPALQQSALPVKAVNQPLKVDFVVRSWYKDLFLLEELLLSMSIFWPFGKISTQVFVVLDKEHPQTLDTCWHLRERFGTFTHCRIEELPSFWPEYAGPAPKRPKAFRVHYSTFWSDLYARADADFIGVLDSDVVFHSFGIESLLFAPPASMTDNPSPSSRLEKPRPVVTGRWSPAFAFSTLAVQDEYSNVSFMDSLPMVVHRDEFQNLREHIRKRFAQITGASGIGFNEAFAIAWWQVDIMASSSWFLSFQGEFLCWQAAMGTFIWKHQRQHYHFSIRGGHALGLSPQSSCPSLRFALHATNLKRAALLDQSVDYAAEAQGMVAAGLCEAAIAGAKKPNTRKLSAIELARCKSAKYQAFELLTRSDDTLEKWPPAETKFCKSHNIPSLLRRFREILANYAAGNAHRKIHGLLRRALQSNGTRKYANDPDAHSQPISGRLEIMLD